MHFLKLAPCSLLLLYSVGLAAMPELPPPYVVRVQHFSTERGLPNRFVLTLGQDNQGFVWVGTLNNAFRFDGQQFEPLPELAKKPENAPFHPLINHIHTDRAGNLWLAGGLADGLRKLLIVRPGEKQPRPFAEAFGCKDPFQHDPIFAFSQTDNRSFQYLFTLKGKIVYHRGRGNVRTIGRWFPPNASAELLGSLETPQGTLWVSVRMGRTAASSTLFEIDSLGHTLHRHEFSFPIKPIAQHSNGSIYLQKSAGNVEFNDLPRLSDHKLDRFLYQLTPASLLHPISVEFAQCPFADKSANKLVHLTARYDALRNLFWISGSNVCFAWHPTNGVVFDLLKTTIPTPGMQQFVPSLIDRTGAVWFGSDDGVVLLTLEPNRFTRYLHQVDQKPTAPRHSIRGMMQHGNQLWANANESHWVDLSTGKSRPVFPVTDSRFQTVRYLYPVINDSQGNSWSVFYKLVKVTPSTSQIATYPLQSTLSYNTGTALWHDGQQKIWIGYDRGLSVFDIARQQNHPFTGYNRFPELAQNRVNGFFPDGKTGRVWVAASSGLYLLDTLRGIMARYSTRDNALTNQNSVSRKTSALPFDHITFVHPDPDQRGVYWLATRGGGLIRWNQTTGQYQQFTEKQGLSNNAIYCIYEDRHQRLWLPSDYGLMAFHRKTHQLQIFHAKDGIADEEFNLTAHYRSSDGRLFLGGLNGITAFYPDSVFVQPLEKAPLVATRYQTLDFETGNMRDQTTQFQGNQTIRLEANNRLFSLSFSLHDYRYLDNTRLWYRVVGWQDKWVMQRQMELRMNGLPSGDYTLEVRAQTNNGDWISPIVRIPVSVAQPIYLQTWFLLLLVLGLALCIRGYLWYRTRKLLSDKARLEAEVARRIAQIEHDKAIIEQQAADLEASAKLKSRFFANVSHEFRTPLMLLLGPIESLSTQLNSRKARSLLEVMDRNARQLLNLVNDLLDLSKLDARQLTLAEQPADLSHTVRLVLANFRVQAQYVGIQLTEAGTDSPLVMPFDQQKVETVLRNLLSNGIAHTSPGGTIHVSLIQTQKEAILTVSDTGMGIHPDDLPYIFDRYFQSAQPNKPLRGGTGIGLAICQEYCQLWGGTLTVGSQLEKGSTFTLTYPIRAHHATVPALLPIKPQPSYSFLSEKPVGEAPADAPTILVVDDNPDMVFYIASILAPHYQLHTARNGFDALEWLKSTANLPSIILSDIMMPEVDGLELVKSVRQDASLQHLPIVLLTARADLEARLEALQLGVTDYLTKPFYESELLARIQNLLVRADERFNWQRETQVEPLVVAEVSDEHWIKGVQELIRGHIADSRFNVRSLAELTHLSERSLYRRVKTLTGLSPNLLIQEVRLQVAHELLQTQPPPLLKSVAHGVGYQKVFYFRQLYRERFGINPGESIPALSERVQQ